VRFLPRTLLWRTFLLVAAVILVAVAAWFQIFRAYEREPRARNLAQMVASVVNITRTAIITARPDLRRALLLDLTELEGIRVYPSDDDERIEIADEGREGARLLNEEIRQRLGYETRIASSRNDEDGFFVSFRIDDDEYWVMMPRERFERRIALQWLGWAALALGLALAAAYIGRGRAPPPLGEDGPQEIETLARAFNQMSRDLVRLEADRALILAGVSHDLRTPLARLRLGIEMSEGDAALRQGMASDIDEMDRIIGQFLDFARSGSEDTSDAVDVAEIASDLVRHYAEVGHPVAADIRPTRTRPLRRQSVRRAIANLVDNAHRYAGGEVELRTATENGAAVVEVLDRGPGIPPEHAERMKQPFTRMESARSNAGGSGLGLAIVDRIAQMHGGRLELLARDGGGLRARIILP
jgi:two-component system osmolarity sensor histidine kinase EnvZ